MSIRLLGLDFADMGLAEVADWVLGRPAGAPFDYVVTPNADHFVRLRRDPELLAIYQDAALRLLDSRVVAGLASVVGLPVPPVVTGSDLVEAVLRLAPRDAPMTIIGLNARHVPALVERTGIAPPAHYDPPMGLDRDPGAMGAAVEFVLAHPARLVLLAVGSPRQERLAAAIRATGRATGVGLCIGAGLEFLAGAARRAPGWMQRGRLGWLYRLAGNPRRLGRRYLWDDLAVVGMMMKVAFALRATSASPRLHGETLRERPQPTAPR